MTRFDEENRHMIHHVVEPTLPVYYRPKVIHQSEIISEEQVRTRQLLLIISLNSFGLGFLNVSASKILSWCFVPPAMVSRSQLSSNV